MTASTSVDLSIVIPTYQRRERLAQVLDGLARQHTDARFETIVVSDGCTDGTDEFLTSGRTAVPVLAVRQDNGGPAAARNRGVDAARGTLLLFLDDDLIPTPSLVARHLDVHRSRPDDELVVIGPMLDPDDPEVLRAQSPWVAWEQAMLRKQYDAMTAGRWGPTARQFFTANASMPRRLLLAAGGFDPDYRRLEDVELAYRLEECGAEFVFEPAAVGHHHAERTYGSWIDMAYEYGRNEVVLARRQSRHWVVATIHEERRRRHPAIRVGLELAARPVARRILRRGTETWATSPLAPRTPRVTRALLSTVYNEAYYRGVSDELSQRPLEPSGRGAAA